MIVTWSLFTMWVAFNLVEIAISWLAVQVGASEKGVLYGISGPWWSFAINKMVLAVIIGVILVYSKKESVLALVTLVMAGLCVWSGWVLLVQRGGEL